MYTSYTNTYHTHIVSDFLLYCYRALRCGMDLVPEGDARHALVEGYLQRTAVAPEGGGNSGAAGCTQHVYSFIYSCSTWVTCP